MIRRIEDIIPPDRPDATEPPRPRRVVQEEARSVPEERPQEMRIDHELVERESVAAPEREGYIDEPPPYISRIPSREERKDAFLDRRPKERTPLSVHTQPKTGFLAHVRRLWVPVSVLVLVLAYVVLATTVFFKVEVHVVPKSERVVLNAHVTAKKDAPEGLAFTVFSVTATETKDVVASETKNVSVKSSGKIVVYNEYSAASQRLIKNTRFQAANGKIFRISESIVVPGVTTIGGKKVPGKIEVTVYADAPGADYNIPLTDFTVPGFKGDPRYQKFYARSKTPMTGGFVGEMRVVGDDVLASAREELEKTLRARLVKQAKESVPKEFVLYDEAMYLVTRPPERTDVEGSESAVRLVEAASLNAVMIPRARLSSALAADAVPNYDGAPVTVPSLDLLHVSVTPKEGSAWQESQLYLTVSGDAEIVWTVDVDGLVTSVLGKGKSEFQSLLSSVPSIEEAHADFSPFWWPGRFPSDRSRIDVVVDGQE